MKKLFLLLFSFSYIVLFAQIDLDKKRDYQWFLGYEYFEIDGNLMDFNKKTATITPTYKEFGDTDWTLVNICPLAGGESVYKARAILSYLNGYATEFDDATLCGKGNEILNKSIKNTTDIKVFPNPAKDQIFIKYTINQDAQFEIWDILGKKITNGKLKKDSNLHAIETASFPNGSYFIKIFDEVNNLNISTINIIH